MVVAGGLRAAVRRAKDPLSWQSLPVKQSVPAWHILTIRGNGLSVCARKQQGRLKASTRLPLASSVSGMIYSREKLAPRSGRTAPMRLCVFPVIVLWLFSSSGCSVFCLSAAAVSSFHVIDVDRSLWVRSVFREQLEN